ncbi:MAG: MMPL family transporter, partial [Gammaproteobacteria bacterium]
MKRSGWIVFGIVVLLVAGLTRLQLEADIFNLLPRDSRMVRSLQLYQQDFGSSNELVLLLRTDDAASTSAAAERLAEVLKAAGLTERVIWRNPFRGNPEELGELLAYLWLNQPPDALAALAERFSDARMPAVLDQALERMAVSFQPLEVARLSMDPFELGAVAGEARMAMPSAGEDPFASGDGTARILAVAAPFESAGFFRLRGWVRDVDDWLIDWQSTTTDFPGLTVGVTGNPAFVVESGGSLLRDVSSAAFGTMVIVALLFWLVHRRWRPLLWLITLLTGVLAATALLGGAIFGTLNAVSLGFAAILLGLAADYGLILYQEMVAHPGRRVSDYRAAVAPAILWSAVTTAGAFFMIGRSSLPGLTQLGVLVGAGVLIAAVVMLLAYLPLVGMRGEAPSRMSPATP